MSKSQFLVKNNGVNIHFIEKRSRIHNLFCALQIDRNGTIKQLVPFIFEFHCPVKIFLRDLNVLIVTYVHVTVLNQNNQLTVY